MYVKNRPTNNNHYTEREGGGVMKFGSASKKKMLPIKLPASKE